MPTPRTATSHITCIGCGAENVYGAPVCSACGTSLAELVSEATTVALPAIESDPEVIEAWHRLRAATIGEYDIYAPLGRGGMATVFLALDLALERQVAIKVVSPAMIQTQSLIQRFKREARTSAALSHPNIIPVYAVKEVDGLAFFIMKYVDGRTLESIIRDEGPLSFDVAISLLTQVGEALHFAHRKGVVHRDVKPANVMIDQDGWAIVTDFGIAKVADAGGLTSAGLVVGTPSYMSPEQFSSGEITGAADQYSLGIVAYEMLTGRRPFGATTLAGVMRSHILDAPEAIRTFRPDISEGLEDVILRMLEKEPAKRWASVGQAVAALESLPREREEQARSAMMLFARSGARDRPRISVPLSPVPTRGGIAPAQGTVALGRAARLARTRWIVGLSLVAGVAAVVQLSRPKPPATVAALPVADTVSRTLTATEGASDPVASGAMPAPRESKLSEPPDKAATDSRRDATPGRAPTHNGAAASAKPASAAKQAALQAADKALRTDPPAEPPAAAVPAVPRPTEGAVRIGSKIPNAVLYLDDKAQGFISGLRMLTLPASSVRIGIHVEGCVSWDSTLVVPPGDTLRIGFRNPTCPP
jgi:hypothetical protein